MVSSVNVWWKSNKLSLPSVVNNKVNTSWMRKEATFASFARLNVLSAFISWSCAPWELSSTNWFFSVYQKRSCCMHALITASLYTGSLQCTFVGLQSSVCQQGWPWGSRNAMNNWLKSCLFSGCTAACILTILCSF